jgi:CRP-like cAMP-binding protein
MPDALPFLTPDDEGLLRSAGTRLHYSRGDLLARKGTPVGGMVIVRDGRVRFELNDRRGACALAVMEPVHLIGEGTLLGGEREHLSVFAEDEVDAEVIDGRLLREIVDGNSGFAARLFRAIASALADRCAQMARTAAPPLGWE